MFGFEKYFCIGCGFNKQRSSMVMLFGDIGLCRECSQTIHSTKDMTFCGREYVDIVIAPFLYDGIISEAVREFKYSGQRLYGTFLTALALEYLKKKELLSDCDIIIPVPLHKNRFEERGYNQSEIIADRLAKVLKKQVNTSSLFRIRDTVHQSSLTGYDRIKNVKDAFLAQGNSVCGKKVLLVDDIYTMGETANQCARALKNVGAEKVTVFALCKAIEKSSLK